MDTHVLENLVLKISNGDLEALEGLYRDYRHAVFTYSLHLLRDRSQAEDNTQDVFLQIWSKASTYRTGSNPAAWIMRMTHNMAIDRYRRSTRLVSFEELPENESLMGANDEDRIADRIDLQTVLGMLEQKTGKLSCSRPWPAYRSNRSASWRNCRSAPCIGDIAGHCGFSLS